MTEEEKREIFASVSDSLDQEIEKCIASQQEGYKEDTYTQCAQIYNRLAHHIHRDTRKPHYLIISLLVFPFFFLNLFFLAGSLFDSDQAVVYDSLFVPYGEKQTLILSDGSKVMLNAGSQLNYPLLFKTKTREVQLTGEAFFSVAKDNKRPFVIHTSAMDLQVHGTTFNLKAYAEDDLVVTTVQEGCVQVWDKKRNLFDCRLFAGDRISFDKQSQSYLFAKNNHDEEVPNWTTGVLKFKDTPMKELLTELSRCFNVEFQIDDPLLYDYSYTFTCAERDLTEILENMSIITPVSFRKEQNRIAVLSRKKR